MGNSVVEEKNTKVDYGQLFKTDQQVLIIKKDGSKEAFNVQKVVDANPQSIADYKAGKDRAIGFLVGQIMKETKGKANPQIVNKLLLEIINK